MKQVSVFLFLTVLLFGSTIGAEEVTNNQESLESLAKEMASIKSSLAETKLALETTKQEANWVWTCIAAFLVFFMQAGFAYVEAGFTRAKNAVNILMKNFSDLTVGAIAYWVIGFSIMFGPQVLTGFGVGVPSFAESLINAEDGSMDPSKYTFYLPNCICCHCRNDCFGSDGGKDKVLSLSGFFDHHHCFYLSNLWLLCLGELTWNFYRIFRISWTWRWRRSGIS